MHFMTLHNEIAVTWNVSYSSQSEFVFHILLSMLSQKPQQCSLSLFSADEGHYLLVGLAIGWFCWEILVPIVSHCVKNWERLFQIEFQIFPHFRELLLLLQFQWDFRPDFLYNLNQITLALSMPVLCTTLDVGQCQSLDQVQSIRLDQAGPILVFRPMKIYTIVL